MRTTPRQQTNGHEHKIRIGNGWSEAATFTDADTHSSHVHRLHDGRLEPAKVRDVWHTHEQPKRLHTSTTYEMARQWPASIR